MTPPYDPDNIFAKILRGEIPAHKVYEDAHTLAFMDVMPQGEGHTLVIPKVPSRGLLDAEPATLAALIASVQWVGRAVRKAFDADGLTVFQFNEPAGGQTVGRLERRIKAKSPDVKRVFIEIQDRKAHGATTDAAKKDAPEDAGKKDAGKTDVVTKDPATPAASPARAPTGPQAAPPGSAVPA